MRPWVFWVVAAALLGIAEIATLGLVLGLVALAALVAAVVAGVGGGVVVQVLAFAASALALLALVRPVARRHLHTPSRLRTGVAALVGSRAVVVERVDGHGGRVRIGGEIWSARAYDETQVIEAGTTVDVLRIHGATALVHDSEAPWQPLSP